MKLKFETYSILLILTITKSTLVLSQETHIKFSGDTIAFKATIEEMISKEEYIDEDNSLFFTAEDILNPQTPHQASILELTEMILEEKPNVSSICNCYLKNDTLIVIGGLGYNDYIYFQLGVHGDKNYGTFGLVDMARLLTSRSNEMKNVRDLEIPMVYSELRTISKPVLDGIVYGEGNAKTGTFFEMIDNDWIERQMQIRFIFKCTVTDHGPY